MKDYSFLYIFNQQAIYSCLCNFIDFLMYATKSQFISLFVHTSCYQLLLHVFRLEYLTCAI